MRIILILTSLRTTLLLAKPALADAKEIKLHQGLGEQNRVGKLFLRGGVELDFEDSRFGGVSAMQIERGGRTAYLMTGQGHLAEVTLEYNTAGNLSGAQLVGIRDIIGAGGRGISSAIEAVARIPDGGWLVAFERKNRLMHFTRSVKPLQTVPRLLNTPVGLERARSRSGIEAASATADRKILLIAEDMPTTRGFTFAWLGDGVRWTPMTYALLPLTSRQAPDPARRPDPDPRSRPAPAALCDGKFRGDCLFPGPAGPDAYFCRER